MIKKGKKSFKTNQDHIVEDIKQALDDIPKLRRDFEALKKAHEDLIQGKADSLMALVRGYLLPGIRNVVREVVKETIDEYDPIAVENRNRGIELRMSAIETRMKIMNDAIGQKLIEELFSNEGGS